MSVPKKPMTKSDIINALAEATSLSRKDVSKVISQLTELIGKEIGKQGPQVFNVPGLMKISVITKPATKSKQQAHPFKPGEMLNIKAKPARKIVKIRPLKALKHVARRASGRLVQIQDADRDVIIGSDSSEIVVSDESSTLDIEVNEGKPDFRKTEVPSVGRHVNAWIQQGHLPLVVSKSVQIGVNIGKPRRHSIDHREFHEPDWGHWQHLDLLICLNGSGAHVTPGAHPVTLFKTGDTAPVFFDVSPQRVGKLELYLSIFLAKEMTLLEELSLTLSVGKALAEVLP